MSSADAGVETAAPCAHVMARFIERVLQQRRVAEVLFQDEHRANAVMTLLLDFVQVQSVLICIGAHVVVGDVCAVSTPCQCHHTASSETNAIAT